ncbi:MAG: AMP-dependent synthetase, partial [Calditrichota bacterium]
QPNSVGKPLGFSEGRIDPDTGELQIKQPWVMEGYYKAPELSEKVLKDGWFHTGDKGEIDEKGFIKIIGRVGDTFKTTKGEFIIPTNIEDHFNQNEMLEQVCVLGIGLTQPVIVGVLSEIGQAADKAEVTKRLEANLTEANSKLQPYEKLATLIVASEEWDVENHLMTPTLKVRRSAVMDHYRSKLAGWHDSSENVIWE